MQKDGIHLLMPEPWMWYEDTTYTGSYLTPLHRHSAWQLTASVDGEFYFRMPEGVVRLASGDCLLIAPGHPHEVGSDSPCSQAIQIFFRRFPPWLLPESASCFNMLRGITRFGHLSPDFLLDLASRFRNKTGEKDSLGMAWKSVLASEFVVSALSSFSWEETMLQYHPAILMAIEYMEEHFAEPVGIPEFAEVAKMSESRFAAVFREKTGNAPMHFFNTIRLGRAQEMLLNGISVNETARATGFISAQYFCRFFRRQTGVSPGAFRKNPFQQK